MTKKKSVMVVAHFCDYGDEQSNNRFNYIANLLAEHGYAVTLVTSSFSHRNKKQRTQTKETDKKYQTVLLQEPSYRKNISLKRLFWSHRVFARNLKRYLRECQPPDLVYCAVPSLSCAKAAADFCRKKRVKFAIDIQDLWPEAFMMVCNPFLIGRMVYAPLRRKADSIYQTADAIVAVSDTYRKRGVSVAQKDKNGRCVYLGTDLQAFDSADGKVAREKGEDELWVVYAGTLGASYHLKLIFDALHLLEESLTKNMVFKVLGEGPMLEEFRRYAEICRVKTEFVGKLPYGEMAAYLKKADIAVNPILKGSAASIINKHADYAAAGLPVVNTQESPEYRQLLDTYACGINCDVDSAEQVAAALKTLITDKDKRIRMGENSRRMAQALLDRKTTYNAIAQTVDGLIAAAEAEKET